MCNMSTLHPMIMMVEGRAAPSFACLPRRQTVDAGLFKAEDGADVIFEFFGKESSSPSPQSVSPSMWPTDDSARPGRGECACHEQRCCALLRPARWYYSAEGLVPWSFEIISVDSCAPLYFINGSAGTPSGTVSEAGNSTPAIHLSGSHPMVWDGRDE